MKLLCWQVLVAADSDTLETKTFDRVDLCAILYLKIAKEIIKSESLLSVHPHTLILIVTSHSRSVVKRFRCICYSYCFHFANYIARHFRLENAGI